MHKGDLKHNEKVYMSKGVPPSTPCPMSHLQPSGSAPSCSPSPASGCKPTLVPTKLRRRARPQGCGAMSLASEALAVDLVCSYPATISVALGPVWLLKGESVQCRWDGSLLSFSSLSLGWGRRFSFKQSNLFPGSSQVCASASLHPIPFLDLPRFRAPVPPFPRFSWARLLPVIVVILAPASRALTRPVTSWLLLRMRPAKAFPLYYLSTPPPVIQVSGLVFPRGYWKTGLFCLLGD